MHSTITITSSIRNYSIEFINSLTEIEKLIAEENTITVIDKEVAEFYPTLSTGIIILSNEEAKTLSGAEKLLDLLATKKANIKTKLVGIGGGVLQDLVGFCASVYARGIEYILVPTTLLAQADSCVGGKTSINLNSRKNLIGTFYPPSRVLIYTSFLSTITDRDLISGFGEIYKFKILQGEISNLNLEGNIEKSIKEGLTYKIGILSKDEFDRGERRFLNYGHTFGHALESISEYYIPHGLAVILGCMIATRVAASLGYDVKDYSEILNQGTYLIKKSKLNLKPEWFNLDSLLEIVKSDKKSTGKLTMVLVDNKPFLENIENLSILEEALKKTYESI